MKNLDYVIKRTAKELGLPESQVKTVFDEYWKAGIDNIIHMKSTTTTLRHIGNFTVSKYKLKNYLKKMIGRIRKFRKEKMNETMIEYYVERMRHALVHRNILAKHYTEMFKKKNDGT